MRHYHEYDEDFEAAAHADIQATLAEAELPPTREEQLGKLQRLRQLGRPIPAELRAFEQQLQLEQDQQREPEPSHTAKLELPAVRMPIHPGHPLAQLPPPGHSLGEFYGRQVPCGMRDDGPFHSAPRRMAAPGLRERLFDWAGRGYRLEAWSDAFLVRRMVGGIAVAEGNVDGQDATITDLRHEGAELEFCHELARQLQHVLGMGQVPTQPPAPERASAPPPPPVPTRSELVAELRERAEMLVAGGHQTLRLRRDIAAEVRAGKFTDALADVGLLRSELRQALELLEDLDTKLGAFVHNECLTCSGPREADSLQCRACQQAEPAPPTLEGELVELRSASPCWDAWRSK
jgi:hypothetical protein